jgi:hypothetical protein
MTVEIVDDDSPFTADDFDPVVDDTAPSMTGEFTARRKIEELMERRRLRSLINDPYRDFFDEDL